MIQPMNLQTGSLSWAQLLVLLAPVSVVSYMISGRGKLAYEGLAWECYWLGLSPCSGLSSDRLACIYSHDYWVTNAIRQWTVDVSTSQASSCATFATFQLCKINHMITLKVSGKIDCTLDDRSCKSQHKENE